MKFLDKLLGKKEINLKDLATFEKPEMIEEVPYKKDIICTRGLVNVKNFTKKFKDSALQAEKEMGVSALVLLAQSALETGWGNKVLKVTKDTGELVESNNLFNIKHSTAWKGEKGWALVPEFINNKWVTIKDYFRVYPNYAESFKDYFKFIKENKRYAKAVKSIDNPELYVQEMAKAGYATDPNYASMIISIMKSNWKEVNVA